MAEVVESIDTAALRRQHTKHHKVYNNTDACWYCDETWPCFEIQAANELDKLRGALTKIQARIADETCPAEVLLAVVDICRGAGFPEPWEAPD